MNICLEPHAPRTMMIMGAVVSGGDWLSLAKQLEQEPAREMPKRKPLWKHPPIYRDQKCCLCSCILKKIRQGVPHSREQCCGTKHKDNPNCCGDE